MELRKPTCQRRLSRTVRSTSFAPEDNDTPKPTFAICTGLPKEHAAVHVLLDRARYFSPKGKVPPRTYVVGEIPNSKGSKHEIVLALADSGSNSTAQRVALLLEDFPTLIVVIMVGIAGGVPNVSRPDDHVRLGDSVVSDQGGVIQYDFVRETKHSPRRAPEFHLPLSTSSSQSSSIAGRATS